MLVALASTSIALILPVAVAGPAHADRCQPEELAGLPGVIPEDENPVCQVMDSTVYPAVGCPAPSTTLVKCASEDNVAVTTGRRVAVGALATVFAAAGFCDGLGYRPFCPE